MIFYIFYFSFGLIFPPLLLDGGETNGKGSKSNSSTSRTHLR